MSDFDQIQARHEKEKAELEARITDMLASATSKNERKRLNKQAEQMRRDLFDKQSKEADDPFIQSIVDSTSNNDNKDTQKDEPKQETTEQNSNRKKKSQKDIERNRQQRQKKMQQRYKLESELTNFAANSKTKGQIEIEKLNDQLQKVGLKMHQIIGDGNCLYRAIAYSLAKIGLSEYNDAKAYIDLRKRAADELRSNPSKYMSFSTCETPEEFEAHCERVEKSSDWGDDLELVALSNALEYSFNVYRADQDPIKRGEFPNSLDLAFLAFYTTSGGHYNSVIPYTDE